jgi:hypothetical protein
VYAGSLKPHARFLRPKIEHISANSKQNKKKDLARESGAQGVLFDEKTDGQKFRGTVPLIATSDLKDASIEGDFRYGLATYINRVYFFQSKMG